MSLVEPVLPPGYGFAVIDKNCNVLFHSDASRNNRENFCQESMGIAELRPWLFGENRSAVDISYAGLPERAFISLLTPSSNSLEFVTGPAFLVTFRTAEYALTLNLATILVSVILLLFNAVLLLLTAVLLLVFREPLRLRDAARLLWPCPGNGLKYLQIFTANCSILLFYAGLYGGCYEALLLTLTKLNRFRPVCGPEGNVSRKDFVPCGIDVASGCCPYRRVYSGHSEASRA